MHRKQDRKKSRRRPQHPPWLGQVVSCAPAQPRQAFETFEVSLKRSHVPLRHGIIKTIVQLGCLFRMKSLLLVSCPIGTGEGLNGCGCTMLLVPKCGILVAAKDTVRGVVACLT